MPHDHDHTHHAHAPQRLSEADLTPAFRLAVWLNAGFVLLEAAAGFWTNSLALLADAAHNLTDVAGLLIAWGAATLARKPGRGRFTWGFGRATLLAALANGVAILLGSGAVIWEAIGRLSAPQPVAGGVVIAVALVGIGVNTGTALLFRGHGHDLNARGAYLHMAADAAVSLAVVLGALGMIATGWLWLDPALAIAVSLLIAVTAAQLAMQAGEGLMDAVPQAIDQREVVAFLSRAPGVEAVHDLHIWQMSSTRVALSVHLLMPGGGGDAFIESLAGQLEAEFGIGHVTVQVETTLGCSSGNLCI